MSLPEAAYGQLTPDMRICRILNGMWQVSGAHGPINPGPAIESMFAYVDSGFNTWDLADHYGPAEDFIGEFRRRLAASHGQEALSGYTGVYQVGAKAGAYDKGNRRREHRYFPE